MNAPAVLTCPPDCDDVEACITCDHPACAEHPTEHLTICVDGGLHCDEDCRDQCAACLDEIEEQRAVDYALDQWRGI